MPLEPPQSPAEIGVGEGEAQEGQDVGDHQIYDLVDVVHEGDVGLPVWPDQDTGGGACHVVGVCLGGGVEESRRRQG